MVDSPALLLHKLVWELDRAADQVLRASVGISYKRALFLYVLHQQGTMTQHELALALGYSDPAVSTMLLELAKAGYTETTPSKTHGRKHLVSLTSKGEMVITEVRSVLDIRFDKLMLNAGVDAEGYGRLTEQIYRTLTQKSKGE